MTWAADLAVARGYDAWFDRGWGAYAFATERGALLDALAPVAGQRILDIGCGTGRFTAALAEAVRAVEPGGRLAVAALNPSSPWGSWTRWAAGLRSARWGRVPGMRLAGPVIERLGRLAPGWGAFQIRVVHLSAPVPGR